MKLNCQFQYYKGLPLQLIHRSDYKTKQAKRFTINHTNQNVWIPNKHLLPNGTIKENENLDYVFAGATRQLELAGVIMGFHPVTKPVKPSIRQQERGVHPSYSWLQEEDEHPEINNMDDYFMHGFHDQPF